MSPSDYNNDGFLFATSPVNDEPENTQPVKEWKVLIVDDDPEIHSVTKLALNDLTAFDGVLSFYHAYSGEQAIDFLRVHRDIAIILLDVVMESENAGLQVAKAIRNELQLDDVRIVLRTGQPGYAPEESVVKDYDINDYKTKTELTRNKLVTTIVSSLRSYIQIRTIKENKRGLEDILEYGTV
jgi:CheY-like chemotaxis protein